MSGSGVVTIRRPGTVNPMHLVKALVAGCIFAADTPFVLVGGARWNVALGTAWLLLDAGVIAWACARSMWFLRTRTKCPEVLRGLPIIVVAPVVYLAINCLVLLVFYDWPALPHLTR